MKVFKNTKEFFLLTVSAIVIALGIYFFKFPNNFTFGGVSGIAVLVGKTGFISPSDFTFVFNMLLLAIGFIFSGKSFGIKTAYISILLSVTLIILEKICPLHNPLTDEPVLEFIFAIALPAIGEAILFNNSASSGGTDIIAILLKKYTDINIGRALFITDLVIVTASCFIFDLKTGLFSVLGLAIKSLLIDSVIEDINLCKYFNVICNNPEPICDFIINNLRRSATICEATGAFTHSEKYIIFTVLNRQQAFRLKHFLKDTDPSAFILISKTSEIIGKGFQTV